MTDLLTMSYEKQKDTRDRIMCIFLKKDLCWSNSKVRSYWKKLCDDLIVNEKFGVRVIAIAGG